MVRKNWVVKNWKTLQPFFFSPPTLVGVVRYDTIRYAAANLIREHDTIDIGVVAETQQGNDSIRMDETLMASLGTCCLPGGYATATVDGKAGANGRGLLLLKPFSKRVTFHS